MSNDKPPGSSRPSIASKTAQLCDRTLERYWMTALRRLDLSTAIPCALEVFRSSKPGDPHRFFICQPPSVRQQRKIASGDQIKLHFASTTHAALGRCGFRPVGEAIKVEENVTVRIWGKPEDWLAIDWSTGSLSFDEATPPIGVRLDVLSKIEQLQAEGRNATSRVDDFGPLETTWKRLRGLH